MHAKPISPKHFIFYFLFALTHLITILSGHENSLVAMISKVLLLPALMVVFYRLTRNRENRQRKFVFAALILSWIGDVTLMFQERNSNFFLIGLICFLLAHISYIPAFNLPSSIQSSLMSRKPWLIIFFIAYAFIIFSIIYHGLGDMLIPVIIYMCVILTMGMSALNRFGKVSKRSFLDVFMGAILFICSDSLLAINKFYEPFALASFLIMLTYIAAQYFIVIGMVEEGAEKTNLSERI